MADEVCYAPDGKPVWSFGLNNLPRTIILALLIGFVPLVTVLLGPKLVFWLGAWAGSYLRTKTAGRKSQILELTENNQKDWEEEQKDKKGRRDSDDWEKVDQHAAGTAKNGEKGEAEWDGIVGFFHPFWYASSGPSAHLPLIGVVTLAAVVNESFGLRYEQHRSAGRKQSVLSTRGIMM